MSKNNATNNIFLNQPVTQTATNYTALATDVIIEVTNTSAPRTITLPAPSAAASTSNVGKFYVIKDTSGGAATNNISVVAASGTIDGSGSLIIGTNYGAAQVYTDGINYYSQALITSPTTGSPLARASWARFSGGFTPVTTVPTMANWQTLGSSAARLDVTGLTQIFTPVNLTVAAQNITIIRSGLYIVNFFIAATSTASANLSCQAVTNGAVVAAAMSSITTSGLSLGVNATITYLNNFVAGDIFDIRFGINTGTFSCFCINYSINQLPTTF